MKMKTEAASSSEMLVTTHRLHSIIGQYITY